MKNVIKEKSIKSTKFIWYIYIYIYIYTRIYLIIMLEALLLRPLLHFTKRHPTTLYFTTFVDTSPPLM
jgi:hypothetical protein